MRSNSAAQPNGNFKVCVIRGKEPIQPVIGLLSVCQNVNFGVPLSYANSDWTVIREQRGFYLVGRKTRLFHANKSTLLIENDVEDVVLEV